MLKEQNSNIKKEMSNLEESVQLQSEKANEGCPWLVNF